ncbi:MAG: 4-hydroxy-tetrahydrodipicolinate reductase, partial [Candidatus Omnitrophota bacterium]|nr:4-hydroxy-tetrahydrodipicolinate reductase [Candidatus Omnitrophota bacterium]
MVRICVSGSEGKMGSRIISLSKEDGDLQVTGQFDIGGAAEASIENCDCLIDFTAPKATMANLAICEKHKKAIVIGTTGLSEEDKARIREASSGIPIALSPNMSIGVNLLFKLIEEASKALGDDYDANIVEAHHTEKKDAPSGTAKEIAKIIKGAKGDIDIPIESVREGEVVGEHT